MGEGREPDSSHLTTIAEKLDGSIASSSFHSALAEHLDCTCIVAAEVDNEQQSTSTARRSDLYPICEWRCPRVAYNSNSDL